MIDLRENGGGANAYPEQLLSILYPTDKRSFAHGLAFPVNPHTGWLLSNFLKNPVLEARNLGNFSDNGSLYWDSYEKAISEERSFTDVILPNEVACDSDVGGYSENIVVLLTSKCASACEVTAGLLKNSGRAILVGTPSNGTGAGHLQISGNVNVSSGWKDSKDVLSIEIPNFLFVIPEKGFDTFQHILSYEDYKKFVPENIPVEPDIPFSVPLSDIKGETNIWLDTAVNVLFPAPAQKAPTPGQNGELK